MTFSVLARKRRRQLSPPSPHIVSRKSSVVMVPALPMTPPDPDVDPIPSINPTASALDTVVHVISTERAALANLERMYATDPFSRESMERAVEQIAKTINVGGKLVICGVGKSGKIGEKLVATMNSFGIQSCFLHPTEALHGDLGMIKQNDTLLFITFSGKTSELSMVLPHIPPMLPVIAITAHMQPSSCALLSDSDIRYTILLPAPVHEREEISFGLPAPTTSTTVALAVGDALALAVARSLHTIPGRGPAEVFKEFHPGGAIGAAFASSSSSASETPSRSSASSATSSPTLVGLNGALDQPNGINTALQQSHQKLISDIATPLSYIPIISQLEPSSSNTRIADVLAAAVRCPKANFWVLMTTDCIISPTRLRFLAGDRDPGTRLCDVDDKSHVVVKQNWIRVPKSSSLATVRQILNDIDSSSKYEGAVGKTGKLPGKDRVVAITGEKFEDDVYGFVEEQEVWRGDM
ncbi:sugar isomerase [Coccidioides immitis RS]|uniref:Sugar isomerase n=1 Tax=Coccidioides immitis (strain RS) TaxID=246410 RepID=J3KJ08_COCIM|nr:sugar isomerase [Coccidioides immitis RS]EAS35999.3 sugar isomerase [Coccidioides immitis RS]